MKQSERYFRQVKRHIPIGGLRKKEFLCNLQESLAAYAAKNPSALLSDYYAHFGKPEDIAVSFLSEMPYAEINSRMRKGHKAFVMVICKNKHLLSQRWDKGVFADCLWYIQL